MTTLPSESVAVACDPPLHDLGSTTPPTFNAQQPNRGDMGVVTLGPPDGEGTRPFVSRRPLTEAELQVAWTEHLARHGLVA